MFARDGWHQVPECDGEAELCSDGIGADGSPSAVELRPEEDLRWSLAQSMTSSCRSITER